MDKTEIRIGYKIQLKKDTERTGANFIAHEFEGDDNCSQMIKIYFPEYLKLNNIERFESGAPVLIGVSNEIIEEYEKLCGKMYRRLRDFNKVIRHEHPELYDHCRPSQLVIEDDFFGVSKILKIVQPFDMSESCDRYLMNEYRKGYRPYLKAAADIFKGIAAIQRDFHNAGYVILDSKMSNYVIFGPEGNKRVCLIDTESVRKIQKFDEDAEGHIEIDDAQAILEDLEISSSVEYAPQEFWHLIELSDTEEGIPSRDFNAAINGILNPRYDLKVYGALIEKWLLKQNVDYDIFHVSLKRTIELMCSILKHSGCLPIKQNDNSHWTEIEFPDGEVFIPAFFAPKTETLSDDERIVRLMDSISKMAYLCNIETLESKPFDTSYDFFRKDGKDIHGFDRQDLGRLSSSLMKNHVAYIYPLNNQASKSLADAYLEYETKAYSSAPDFKEYCKTRNKDAEKLVYTSLRYMINVDGRSLFECLAEDLDYGAEDPLKYGDVTYLRRALDAAVGTGRGIIAFCVGNRKLNDEDDIVIALLKDMKIDTIIVSDVAQEEIGTDNVIYVDEKDETIVLNSKNHKQYTKEAENHFVSSALKHLANVYCSPEEYEKSKDIVSDVTYSLWDEGRALVDDRILEALEIVQHFELAMLKITGKSKWRDLSLETSDDVEAILEAREEKENENV